MSMWKEHIYNKTVNGQRVVIYERVNPQGGLVIERSAKKSINTLKKLASARVLEEEPLAVFE